MKGCYYSQSQRAYQPATAMVFPHLMNAYAKLRVRLLENDCTEDELDGLEACAIELHRRAAESGPPAEAEEAEADIDF